jgi:thymidylate synthase (FAD)
MNVKVIWSTPDADALMGMIARVSNPANQNNPEVKGLLRYCARNAHWSVFEHAHACLEINTTRDIGRQIIRHRSFAFSEFSQRYQDAAELGEFAVRECRMQDTKNRQNSLPCEDDGIDLIWHQLQARIAYEAKIAYREALARGIAKEQARALLPEGLTPSRLYMTGSIRSWVTYCQVRMDPSTQKEHRLIAQEVLQVLRGVAPITMDAFFPVTESEPV